MMVKKELIIHILHAGAKKDGVSEGLLFQGVK